MQTRARLVAALLLAGLLATGCGSCREKTEEERLAEMLEEKQVKAYAGFRAALSGGASDPAAAKARKALTAFIGETGGERSTSQRLTAARRLVDALEAASELRPGGEDHPLVPPVLKIIDPQASLPRGWGIDEDHTVVGLAWLLVQRPAQAQRFSLYELANVSKKGLSRSKGRLLARFGRAMQFGRNDLCKMAGTEVTAMRKGDGERALRDALAFFGVRAAPGSPEWNEIAPLLPGLRALASGMTAMCHLERDDDDDALPHLEAFCDDVVAMGVAEEEEVAVIQAYVAFKQGDREKALAALRTARRNPRLDAEGRADLDRMIQHLETRSDSEYAAYVQDRIAVADLATRIVIRQIERSGLRDRISASPPVAGAMRFTERIGEALAAVDPRAALEKGAGALEKQLDRLRGKESK